MLFKLMIVLVLGSKLLVAAQTNEKCVPHTYFKGENDFPASQPLLSNICQVPVFGSLLLPVEKGCFFFTENGDIMRCLRGETRCPGVCCLGTCKRKDGKPIAEQPRFTPEYCVSAELVKGFGEIPAREVESNGGCKLLFRKECFMVKGFSAGEFSSEVIRCPSSNFDCPGVCCPDHCTVVNNKAFDPAYNAAV